MELEVGKWYVFYYKNIKSVSNSYYFKYLRTQGTMNYCSEYVYNNDHYKTIAGVCYTGDKLIGLLDLSILKGILPEDYFKDIIHEIW